MIDAIRGESLRCPSVPPPAGGLDGVEGAGEVKGGDTDGGVGSVQSR